MYEIPVGPVHAGVIEPGHFRFNVLGETILKMRARLHFTHKGTERLFSGRHAGDAVELAERVSGDTSIGHAVAFCQAVESLARLEITDTAKAWRAVLLELERLYNHITDAGAIIADTGFPIGQAHCMRLRERVLRLNKRLTGHRLMRGAIVPGGIAQIADAGNMVGRDRERDRRLRRSRQDLHGQHPCGRSARRNWLARPDRRPRFWGCRICRAGVWRLARRASRSAVRRV